MALFNRDYDRDYGYRGNTGYRGGYDRDMGNRGGGWWERTKDRVSDAFGGNDYDRGYRGGYTGARRGNEYEGQQRYGGGYGYRGATEGYGTGGYDRGYTGNTGYYGGTTGAYGTGGYDRGYTGYTGTTGTNRAYGDYGEGYKSRAQTDYGDPFGDRQSGTPIRVVREREDNSWFGTGRNDHDRTYRSDQGYGTTYDRDYATNPAGYDPYYGRGATYRGERSTWEDRGNRRAYDRDYDRGWF